MPNNLINAGWKYHYAFLHADMRNVAYVNTSPYKQYKTLKASRMQSDRVYRDDTSGGKIEIYAFRIAAIYSVLFISLLSGCGITSDVIRFDSINRSPKSERRVVILTDQPVRAHKVIARIQIGPDAFIADYQSQTEELIKRAAALGADAVIVSYSTSQAGYIGGTAITGVYGVTDESKYTIGNAIVYDNK